MACCSGAPVPASVRLSMVVTTRVPWAYPPGRSGPSDYEVRSVMLAVPGSKSQHVIILAREIP